MKSKIKNISGYPENLASLVQHPETRCLYLRIAVFAMLLLLLSLGWYGTHHLVIEKQEKISGIYTLAFFQNDKDARPAKTQAVDALKALQNDSAIMAINIFDNTKITAVRNYPEQTSLPSLLHVKILPHKEKDFEVSLHNLFQNFPSFSVRNHAIDPRVINLQKRYNKFLFILNLCARGGVLLLLSSLAIGLKKWLHPHSETITLLHVIGAEDRTILQVFGKYMHNDIIKGVLIGTICTYIVIILPVQLLVMLDILEHTWKIPFFSLLTIAFLCSAAVYITTRLRIHHVLRQCFCNNAVV